MFFKVVASKARWLRRQLKQLHCKPRGWKNFQKYENFFKAGKKCVLYCKASLIAASDAKTTRALAWNCLQEIFKNIQPISVGVWWRLPSSTELSLNWLTNAHENRSEVHFNSVFMSCSKERKNSRSNYRVWSWLRLNAGGMLYTCKSNGSIGACTWWRVANGWVIHRNVPSRGG